MKQRANPGEDRTRTGAMGHLKLAGGGCLIESCGTKDIEKKHQRDRSGLLPKTKS